MPWQRTLRALFGLFLPPLRLGLQEEPVRLQFVGMQQDVGRAECGADVGAAAAAGAAAGAHERAAVQPPPATSPPDASLEPCRHTPDPKASEAAAASFSPRPPDTVPAAAAVAPGGVTTPDLAGVTTPDMALPLRDAEAPFPSASSTVLTGGSAAGAVLITPRAAPAAIQPDHSAGATTGGGAPATRQDSRRSSGQTPSSGRQCDFEEIVAMGFSEQRVAAAMEACGGQGPRAMELLLDTPEVGPREAAPRDEAALSRSAAAGLGQWLVPPSAHTPSPLCPPTSAGASATIPATGRCAVDTRSPVWLAPVIAPQRRASPPPRHPSCFAPGSSSGRKGAAAAPSSSRRRSAPSRQAQPASRAGYVSCPGCEQQILLSCMEDHLEMACTSRPAVSRDTSRDTAKDVARDTDVGMAGYGPRGGARDGAADGTGGAMPERGLGITGDGCARTDASRAGGPGWDRKRKPAAQYDEDSYLFSPPDAAEGQLVSRAWDASAGHSLPGAVSAADPAAAPLQPVSAPCGKVSAAYPAVEETPAAGSPDAASETPDSQAVSGSTGGEDLLVARPKLATADLDRLSPVSDLSASLASSPLDAFDLSFQIRSAQAYKRGQWRSDGGGAFSAKPQLLPSATFRVPETPVASQCSEPDRPTTAAEGQDPAVLETQFG